MKNHMVMFIILLVIVAVSLTVSLGSLVLLNQPGYTAIIAWVISSGVLVQSLYSLFDYCDWFNTKG